MNPQSGAAGETGGHDLAGGRSNSLPAFVAAYGISLLGDRFAEIALPVLVLQVTGDPAAAGVVGVTVQVPPLVLALWLGGRVDRHSRRGLMVTADIARAICFGVFAFLAAGRVDELWPYLVVGLVVGAGNVLFAIAGTALLPQIVGGRHLVRANATLEAGDAMTAVLGPAAAGVVVAAVGTAAALSVDALSFAISALLLQLGVGLATTTPLASEAKISTPTGSAGHPAEVLRRTWRQLGLVFSDRMQSSVQAALSALSAHGAALVLAIIVLGRSDLHLSVARIGVILAAAGAGGLLASAVTAKWPDVFSSMQAIAATVAVSAGFLVALALAQNFWWALVANGLLDMAITAAFIATGSVRQQRTESRLLGRVSAVSVICNATARVLGVGGVGLLLTTFGGRAALLADAAVLTLAAVIVVWRGVPLDRRKAR